MSKEIVCVYQDCVLCGDRGKKLEKVIISKGLNVRKVSFASPEGRHLIHEAVFGGFGVKFPLFTDGKQFTSDINELLDKKTKNVAKKAKKTPKNTRKVRINEEKDTNGTTEQS